MESKGWKWEIVEDDENSIWKNPCIESYYLLHRWKAQNRTEFLDLGCGLGRHSILFGNNGFNVHCFDISEEAIARTKMWAEAEGLTFEYTVGDMLKLPYQDKSIDCILCRNVISHTDTKGVKQAISEIHRVLNENGECYLTLGSKATWETKHQEWPSVDENTKLRMETGPEYKVPHFYADYDLLNALFVNFKILWVTHVEDFWEYNGVTNSSFHYHLLIKKEKTSKLFCNRNKESENIVSPQKIHSFPLNFSE